MRYDLRLLLMRDWAAKAKRVVGPCPSNRSTGTSRTAHGK